MKRVLLVIMVAGCTSLGDIRRSVPSRVGTFEGRYAPVGRCTMRTLEVNGGDAVQYRFLDDPDAKVATITAFMNGAPGQVLHLYEVLVAQIDPRQLRAEVRSIRTVRSGGYAGETWPRLKRAQPRNPRSDDSQIKAGVDPLRHQL